MTRYRSFSWVTVLALCVFAACSEENPPSTDSNGESTFAPTAETGIAYAGLGESESLKWGPPGIFAIDDGYAIPDAIAGNIVLFDESFHVQRSIDVRAQARGVIAVAEYGNNLVALDAAALRPTLLRIAGDDHIDVFEIPLESKTAPSGLIADESGLILEYDGGDALYRVTFNGEALKTEPVNGYAWNGRLYTLDHPNKAYFHSRSLHSDGLKADITVPDHLGGMQPLGPDGQGGLFLLVESVSIDPVVKVDQLVLRVSPSGDVQAVAHVPLDERLVPVDHGVTISANGDPVVLIPRVDGLEFLHLTMKDPQSFLNAGANPLPNEQGIVSTSDPNEENVGTTQQTLVTAGGGCLTSSQMNSNASEYLSVSTYISSTSINNDASCSGRYTPAYLSSAGNYGSVSYNWGGFNSPSEFISGMASNLKAGNLNTAYVLTGCARGVDCSGFVSRVWGFTYKLGTSNIPAHSKPYTPVLTLGDVLNKVNDHVVVFVANATSGIYAYESTHYINLDRVAYTYRTWSSLSGYQAYRSETSCL